MVDASIFAKRDRLVERLRDSVQVRSVGIGRRNGKAVFLVLVGSDDALPQLDTFEGVPLIVERIGDAEAHH
jgi:hypothetical protein